MTIVCGMGILAFGFSSFVPTSRFAWLMATMLGVGLLGDLILLPSLLAGRLGTLFKASAPERVAPERVAVPAPASIAAAGGMELEPVAI
jgi:hypothetical protein